MKQVANDEKLKGQKDKKVGEGINNVDEIGATLVKLGAIDNFGQQQRRTATRLNDIDVPFNLLKLLRTCLAATEEGSVNLQQRCDTPKAATICGRQKAAHARHKNSSVADLTCFVMRNVW